jgi:squalene-hopene/tetraprenyl-beta-curcumene cyclase
VTQQQPAAGAGLAEAVADAVARATERLLEQQRASGYWQAPVEAAGNLEAEWIFVNRLLGRKRPELEARLVERLLRLQQDDGGWSLATGLPGHLSTSIEVYFALKLVGTPFDHPAMTRARKFILAQGGLARGGLYARFWLACFGQFPWHGVPAMPIEIVLLPPWAPLGIYGFSSWARAVLVPFALLRVHRPAARVPSGAEVDELWVREPRPEELSFERSRRPFTWRNAFLELDKTLGLLGRSPWKPLRRRAVARAIEWILRRQDATGQWGGIQPAMVHSVLALHAVGFAIDHPVMVRGLQGLDDLLVQRDDQLLHQPCTSPNWDTALAVQALLDAGVDPASPALVRAGDWLVGQQIFRPGDWSVRNPQLDPGGWAVEFANDSYPNVDVSAATLLALQRLPQSATPAGRRAIAHGSNWTLGMQHRDGGWAAFDNHGPARFLDAVPFPDMEGLTDPPNPDSTGRMLELLGTTGFGADFGRVRRAIEFLRREQQPDGCWRGRWGVNGIYGTSLALIGLASVSADLQTPWVRRAVDWLLAHQNPDGGWGESPASYDDEARIGRGDSTPTQTSWALLALMAADDASGSAVRRGVEHLVATQRADGTWDERAYTGTGVPRRSYLRYDLYPLHFPLRAIAQYRSRTTVA